MVPVSPIFAHSFALIVIPLSAIYTGLSASQMDSEFDMPLVTFVKETSKIVKDK